MKENMSAIGGRHVKFYMEIDYKSTEKFLYKIFLYGSNCIDGNPFFCFDCLNTSSLAWTFNYFMHSNVFSVF